MPYTITLHTARPQAARITESAHRTSVLLRLVPGRRPVGEPAFAVGAEERVVVMAARRHPVERVRLGELEVQGAAAGTVGRGRGRGVHGIPVVHREVAG